MVNTVRFKSQTIEPSYRHTFEPFSYLYPSIIEFMPDFTPNTCKLLLSTFLDQNYSFQPFIDFLRNPESRTVILRHDVDARKMNSLRTAQLENELGIRGTYYFRIVPESFDKEVIKKIYDLGHEVGYHYEDLSFTAKRSKGTMAQWHRGVEAQGTNKNPLPGGAGGGFDEWHRGTEAQGRKGKKDEELIAKIAIETFRENLEKLRRIVPVETICMHGSPLSRWDNRLLWKYYDYRDFGIVGEPYFDIDFEKVLYLTDTGRRWDGVAVRDKVTGREGLRNEETKRRRDGAQGTELRARGWKGLRDRETEGRRDRYRFHSTFDIIAAAKENRLPDHIMLTIHPQRWDDRAVPWIRELVWQNVKNIIKRALVEKQ